MTIRQAVQIGVEKLSDAGIETPFLDAAVLLAHSMNTTKEKLYAAFTDLLPKNVFTQYLRFIQQRLQGYPVSYIRRKKEFYGRTFYVDERVLVPRPETETLIDAALELCTGYEEPKILDLCTGSGCIAVTMACECAMRKQKADIVGSDISEDAGDVYKKNAQKLYGKELPFVKSDLFTSINGTFDFILSNPPYLTENEVNVLKKNKWPEPENALLGGKQGLALIQNIVKKSVEYLERNGYLLLEADPGQMDAIALLMEKEELHDIHVIRDLGNRNRIIIARW